MTAYAFDELRHKVLPAEQQWWFEAGTPGEWVPLLVYRAGPAEVLWNDRRPGWFHSRERAMGWLSRRGYLPAERALAEHLVDSVPPDIVLGARPRRRLRVEQSGPRVRVAPDAPDREPPEAEEGTTEENDELHEDAAVNTVDQTARSPNDSPEA